MALVAASPLILHLLGPYYEASDAVMVIALLAVASVFRTSFEIWTSTLRARRQTGTVLVCAVAYVAALVPLVLILTPMAGAVGAATALLAVTVALSVAGVIGLLSRRKVAVIS
jgi:O-antigen/teichoic acid export membrane protein